MKQLKNTKVLLLVGMVLLMAACTAAWQRGRNAEQSGQSIIQQKNHDKNNATEDSTHLTQSTPTNLARNTYSRYKKDDNELMKSITEDYDLGIRSFKQDPPISIGALFSTYKAAFGLGADDEMRFHEQSEKYPNGYSVTYKQYYKGLPVAYCRYHLNIVNDIVASGSGTLVGGIDIQVPVLMSQQQAIDTAIVYGHSKGMVFRWESGQEETALKKQTQQANATYYPTHIPLEIIWATPENPKLARAAYFIQLETLLPKPTIWNVNIDANSGKILTIQEEGSHACSQGSVNTEYGGYGGYAPKTHGTQSQE